MTHSAAAIAATTAGVTPRCAPTGGGITAAAAGALSPWAAALRCLRRCSVSLARLTSGCNTDAGSLRARFSAERHAAHSLAPGSTVVPQNSQFTIAATPLGSAVVATRSVFR